MFSYHYIPYNIAYVSTSLALFMSYLHNMFVLFIYSYFFFLPGNRQFGKKQHKKTNLVGLKSNFFIYSLCNVMYSSESVYHTVEYVQCYDLWLLILFCNFCYQAVHVPFPQDELDWSDIIKDLPVIEDNSIEVHVITSQPNDEQVCTSHYLMIMSSSSRQLYMGPFVTAGTLRRMISYLMHYWHFCMLCYSLFSSIHDHSESHNYSNTFLNSAIFDSISYPLYHNILLPKKNIKRIKRFLSTRQNKREVVLARLNNLLRPMMAISQRGGKLLHQRFHLPLNLRKHMLKQKTLFPSR